MNLDSHIRFLRVMALDFYDGAVGGFAEVLDAQGNRDWYRYELISWDTRQNARVFCLASAPAAADVIAHTTEARWPFWWDNIPPSLGAELQQLRIESERLSRWLSQTITFRPFLPSFR